MKNLLKIILLLSAYSLNSYAIEMNELVDRAEIKAKIEKELLKLDVNFGLDLGNIDIINGVSIANRYRYEVEPSYRENYYTRIDKWDVKLGINAGAILSEYFSLPFSFSVNRDSSFLFVRQFQAKSKALDALPYTPYKLPINAKKALELNVGDFVSIPANVNLGISSGLNSSYVLEPAIVNAGISAFFVISGEFTLQVFKLDEEHVRLKLISNRAYNIGSNGSLRAEVNIAGFKLFKSDDDSNSVAANLGLGAKVDHELKKQTVRFIDRIIDRDFINYGVNYSPGASYIADYIFDLTDSESREAYNQILSTAYRLKGILVIDNFLDAKDLKDKLIMTTELADKLADRDRDLSPELRKVTRIFKGFNNYKATNRHIKLGLLFATYQHNTSYVENKLTLTDKYNHNLEFFYPTFSKYFETNLGKWFFNLKDQSFKTYFGLIPKIDNENVDAKNPDLGLTFERKDKKFTRLEQKHVSSFMINQLPVKVINKLNLDGWKNLKQKLDSRIYFQVVLKSQGFNFIRSYSREELKSKLLQFLKEKKLLHIVSDPDINLGETVNNDEEIETADKITPSIPSSLHIDNYYESSQVKAIVSILFHALHDDDIVSENTLKKVLKLNDIPLFANVGIGFLISLVPEENLEEFIYTKVEMIAKDTPSISSEFGTLNYKMLYNEINTIQSRLSNRSYDLRISDEDTKILDTNAQTINN